MFYLLVFLVDNLVEFSGLSLQFWDFFYQIWHLAFILIIFYQLFLFEYLPL